MITKLLVEAIALVRSFTPLGGILSILQKSDRKLLACFVVLVIAGLAFVTMVVLRDDQQTANIPALPNESMHIPRGNFPDLGSCEIDFGKGQGTVPPGETVLLGKNESVLNIIGDIGDAAVIRMTSKNACVVVQGNVGANAHIVANGDDTTVIIIGTTDVTAHIEARGQRSTVWLKGTSNTDVSMPGVAISPEGGELYLKEGGPYH
jgi:hypothetical protein